MNESLEFLKEINQNKENKAANKRCYVLTDCHEASIRSRRKYEL